MTDWLNGFIVGMVFMIAIMFVCHLIFGSKETPHE